MMNHAALLIFKLQLNLKENKHFLNGDYVRALGWEWVGHKTDLAPCYPENRPPFQLQTCGCPVKRWWLGRTVCFLNQKKEYNLKLSKKKGLKMCFTGNATFIKDMSHWAMMHLYYWNILTIVWHCEFFIVTASIRQYMQVSDSIWLQLMHELII